MRLNQTPLKVPTERTDFQDLHVEFLSVIKIDHGSETSQLAVSLPVLLQVTDRHKGEAFSLLCRYYVKADGESRVFRTFSIR